MKLGFDLTDFRIENTDFDEDTRARIGKIADSIAQAAAIGALGGVDAQAMQNYASVQQLSALNTAAANEGGMAGMGVGMGAGFAMGQNMMGGFGAMNPAAAPAGAGAPPPLPSFFASINGAQAGPFDMATLHQMAGAGTLSGTTLVWRQGMAGWLAAASVAELAGLFPPPLPPG